MKQMLLAGAMLTLAAGQASAWECPNGLADLQGNRVFTIAGWSITTGLLGYAATGVMTFDGAGGIAFPDANDSTTPPGGRANIQGEYWVKDAANCVWGMLLVVGSQQYQLSLDGKGKLVGSVFVSNTFLNFSADVPE